VISKNVNVFCLSETWCDSKRITAQSWYNLLTTKYNVIIVDPKKECNMGRSKAGFIIGVDKSIKFSFNVVNSNYAVLVKLEQSNFCTNISFGYFPPDSSVENEFGNFLSNIDLAQPEFVLGDLNARVGEQCISNKHRSSKDKVSNTRGNRLITKLQNYIICNGNVKGDEFGYFTFVNAGGSSVVDLCLAKASEEKNLNQLEIKSSPYSHHSAIILEINKTRNVTPKVIKTSRIKWEEKNSLLFRQELHRIFKSEAPINYDDWCKTLYKAAKMAGLKTEISMGKRNYTPPWGDKELNRLKSLYRYRVKQFRRSNAFEPHSFHESRVEMLNAKCQYLARSEEKKKSYFLKLQNDLVNCSNSKRFWSALKRFNNKSSSSDTDRVGLKEFGNHFTTVFKSSVNDMGNKSSSTSEIVEDEQLDAEFNLFELTIAIKKLSKGKAPGSDGITNEVLKFNT